MNKLHLKYTNTFELLFKIGALSYLAVSFFYFFFIAGAGGGDESLFISDLVFIKTNGWIAAIEKSICIPYMLLAYPFSLIFEEHIALRFTNLILLLALVGYFFKVVKIKSANFYYYLAFYIATVAFFFVGTNDELFFIGVLIFMTEVFYFIENKKMNNEILAFSGLIISFFTRELFYVYLPVIIFGFFFLYKNGFNFFTKKMILPLLLFCFFILVNIPSIKTNHKLSYDDKRPSSKIATWTQRQYLAQLMVNKDELPNFQHPSWEETEAYLKKNGPNSLPDGIITGMTFDYALTITEFFKDFYYSMFYGFRQLGLILLFPFFFIAMNFKKEKLLSAKFFIPYSLIAMISILSLIIISYVELRWYISVFLLAIVFYNYQQTKNNINSNFIFLNYFVLACFSLYGVYGLLHRFIGVI
ncbi:hypothetical protein [Flavobacterium sangjuense]|uniref:Glycosyltransferase RgtA/B/C/D-like domain-containing protein n=1 Tax=Flavobacterium sangjuense TaxID=2518177 RepID=A0A4P7PUC8_9FLAO|nr:hypothetical protein [Flavobacterium sangjuense]QBZ97910.1 hypothetical protein GS03_01408 [Flavobacterium sangjuense]